MIAPMLIDETLYAISHFKQVRLSRSRTEVAYNWSKPILGASPMEALRVKTTLQQKVILFRHPRRPAAAGLANDS